MSQNLMFSGSAADMLKSMGAAVPDQQPQTSLEEAQAAAGGAAAQVLQLAALRFLLGLGLSLPTARSLFFVAFLVDLSELSGCGFFCLEAAFLQPRLEI